MRYLQYATYRYVQKITTDAIEKIKNGSKEAEKEGGLKAGLDELTLMLINSYIEEGKLSTFPIDALEGIELEPFIPVKTDGKFHIINTSKAYEVVQLFTHKRFMNKRDLAQDETLAPDQDVNYYKDLAKRSREILEAENPDPKEKEIVHKMIENHIIAYTAVSSKEFIDRVYQAVKGNPSLSSIYEEATGSKFSKKHLEQFEIEDIKYLSDEVMGLNIFTPYYEHAGYTPVKSLILRGHPSATTLTHDIIEATIEEEKEKSELLNLLSDTIRFVEEAEKIETYSEKERAFTQLKKINNFVARSLESVEKETLLNENKKYGYFKEVFSLKFSHTEKIEYLVPRLDSSALLKHAEKFGIEVKEEYSIRRYEGRETLPDAVRAIKAQLELTNGQMHQKKVINGIKKQKNDFKAPGQSNVSGFAL
ncbi:MAG TPA: hypothetical protein ENN12_03525 [Epsilonproteobacteria bacterium]|nr:hypothetical protein [Campylobacterota bacterium]